MRILNRTGLALLIALSTYSSASNANHLDDLSGPGVICIDPSVITVVFATGCGADSFPIMDGDTFDWESYYISLLPPDPNGVPTGGHDLGGNWWDPFGFGLPEPQPPFDLYATQSNQPPTGTNTVPEPSVLGLLGLGALALAWGRRKVRDRV